jgi:hypothetical protein
MQHTGAGLRPDAGQPAISRSAQEHNAAPVVNKHTSSMKVPAPAAHVHTAQLTAYAGAYASTHHVTPRATHTQHNACSSTPPQPHCFPRTTTRPRQRCASRAMPMPDSVPAIHAAWVRRTHATAAMSWPTTPRAVVWCPKSPPDAPVAAHCTEGDARLAASTHSSSWTLELCRHPWLLDTHLGRRGRSRAKCTGMATASEWVTKAPIPPSAGSGLMRHASMEPPQLCASSKQ